MAAAYLVGMLIVATTSPRSTNTQQTTFTHSLSHNN